MSTAAHTTNKVLDARSMMLVPTSNGRRRAAGRNAVLHQARPARAVTRGGADQRGSYGFIFPGIQVNNISSSVKLAFGLETWVTGIIVTAVLFLVGHRRRDQAHREFRPGHRSDLSIGFVLYAVVIIGVNIDKVPEAILLIVTSALGMDQVFGDIVGFAVQWGVRRAVFASAAGDGEGTYAAAAAQNTHPGKQGIVQAFSIFITVLLICMATGHMIVVSGMYNVEDGKGGFLFEGYPGLVAGPNFVQAAIDTAVPGAGPAFVAVAVFLFALLPKFSTST